MFVSAPFHLSFILEKKVRKLYHTANFFTSAILLSVVVFLPKEQNGLSERISKHVLQTSPLCMLKTNIPYKLLHHAC